MEGVFFPVGWVEEFQGEDALVVDSQEVGDDLIERGDAVAGEDSVPIGDRGARGVGGVIVEMEDLDGLSAEEF